VKFALAEFASQTIFAKAGQDLLHMRNVFFECAGVNEDVVDINDAKDVQEFTETIVGVGLKRGRSIGETKRHNKIFEMSIPRTERCLVLIAIRNSELIVGVGEVKACKVLRAFEAIEEFGHEGKGIAVLDRDVVEFAIIDTKAE
jgi:hypothetical protein